MFPRPSLKTSQNWYTRLLNPLSRIYVGLTPKTVYIGMCTKSKSFWHFPWHGSDSLVFWPSICLEIARIRSFITPFKIYIRKPLVHWRHKRIESKETIVHCCRNLCLSLHPFVPWSTFCVLPKLSFCLWACYWEMEDWGGGGPSGGFSLSDSQMCRQRLYPL